MGILRTAKISHSSSVPPKEARTSALEAFIQNRTFLARTMLCCQACQSQILSKIVDSVMDR